MTCPAHYVALCHQAHAEYHVGHYRTAALLYEQSYHFASRHQLEQEAFSSGTLASGSWHMAGNPHRALLMLSQIFARNSWSSPESLVWEARVRSFEISRCFHPQLTSLTTRLHELQAMLRENPAYPSSDVYRLEGLLLRAQGRHQQAIHALERAWVHYAPGKGLSQYLIAWALVFSQLSIGRREEAASWTRRLGDLATDFSDSRAAWHEAQARLALWDRDVVALGNALASLDDCLAGNQQPIWQRKALMLRIRWLLLQPEYRDPAHPNHLARRAFAQPISGFPEVWDVYDRRLLLVDYRLAALRYAIGLEPVEDLFHAEHPGLSSFSSISSIPGLDNTEISRRIEQVRRAIRRGRFQAEYLDHCFASDCRRQELDSRTTRLETLIAYWRDSISGA